MKLSAKLVTALAALALLVVALAGVEGSSQVRAAGNTDGAVWVTNMWSGLTNQASPPSGRTYVGSGKAVNATFEEMTSDAADGVQNTIEAGSDTLIITVADGDKDQLLPASDTVVWPGGPVNTTAAFTVPLASSPIVDVNGNGDRTDDITIADALQPADAYSIVSVTPGDGDTIPGVIQLISTSAHTGATSTVRLDWFTSQTDSVNATVKSTQNPDGITLKLKETGKSTGVFENKVKLLDVELASNTSVAYDPDATTTISTIVAQSGSTITAEYADDTPSSGSTKTVKTTASVETNAPIVTVTAPSNGLSVQERRPSFSGTVADTGSGLKVSRLFIFIDESDDPLNTITAVDPTPGSADENVPSVPSTAADGDSSVTWTFTPGVDIPTVGTVGQAVDHIVDWQVRASDLAGNVGYSDSDPDTANPQGVGQVHTVKIDQKLPSIEGVFTGQYWDTTLATPARAENAADRIEVMFDGEIDGASVENTDFEVEVDGVTHVPTAADVYTDAGAKGSVFLTLGFSLASDDKPVVRITNQIADIAGNTTSSGSKTAEDSIAPAITVTLSGGSAADDPSGLTKDAMTITVTSDETLSTDPTVQIYDANGNAEGAPVQAIAQGGNKWIATARKTGRVDGKKSVVVTATDNAGAGLFSPNTRTKGKTDPSATGAIVYTLDTAAPTLTTTPADGGSTVNARPFVVLNFDGVVTIDKAEFDGADISADLRTNDNQKYIFKPASDLSLGEHEIVAKATDLAGNTSAEVSSKFTVREKKAFSVALLPGWNFISLPADPVDPSINSVITSADVTAVVGYDASTGTFLSAVRDAATGELMGDLTSVDSSSAFWVQTESFEPIKTELVVPAGGQLPPTVEVVAGWNAVPVLDTSGASSVGDTVAGPEGDDLTSTADYFSGTSIERLYLFDTLDGKFKQVSIDNVTQLKIGVGYWGFFSKAGTIIP